MLCNMVSLDEAIITIREAIHLSNLEHYILLRNMLCRFIRTLIKNRLI